MPWSGFLTKIRSEPGTAITVAGLLLYAVLRVAYVTFYEPFALTPDDLGFGYLDLLGQAAVGAVVLTVLFGGLLSAYVLVAKIGFAVIRSAISGWTPGRDRRAEDAGDKDEREPSRHVDAIPSPKDWVDSFGRLSRAVRSALLVGSALWIAGLAGVGPLPRGIAEPVAYCVVAIFWLSVVRTWFNTLDDAGRARLERELTAAIVVGFVLVAVALVLQAVGDRNNVREGRSAHPVFHGLRLASWGADRASIQWKTEDMERQVPGLQGRCVLYFGQFDGMTFLYRPEDHATLRVPVSEIVVTVNSAACDP